MNPLRRATTALTRRLPVKRVRSRLTRPVASLSFDDFPKSAWTVAGPMLERRGIKATYYAAGGLCGRVEEGIAQYDQADLAAVHDAGHEIACHSFSHRPAPTLSNAQLAEESARNAAFLEGVLPGVRLSSYAYPFGDASPRTKAWAAARFASARGVASGVNAGAVDLAEVQACPLEHRRWSRERVQAWVDAAVRDTGWLVLFTHDVSAAPSPFGATPEMLEHALDALAAAGIEVLPVKHAMARAVFGAAG